MKFHVFRINPPRLVSNIRFVQKFYPAHAMDGYAAYCLTNLVGLQQAYFLILAARSSDYLRINSRRCILTSRALTHL